MLRRLYILLLILCLSLNAQAQDSYYITQLRQIAYDAYKTGNYEAIEPMLTILRAGDFPKDSKEYGECMFFAWYCLGTTGNYPDAIYAGRECSSLLKRSYSRDIYQNIVFL